jgi:RNA polymerase sigma-70 factor, ECF subfamily
MDPAEEAVLRALCDEHIAALWGYVLRLTGDTAHTAEVVQETLRRGWQHPEIAEHGEWAARAWLFTVARNIITDERAR